jgi:hypothetical protein
MGFADPKQMITLKENGTRPKVWRLDSISQKIGKGHKTMNYGCQAGRILSQNEGYLFDIYVIKGF